MEKKKDLGGSHGFRFLGFCKVVRTRGSSRRHDGGKVFDNLGPSPLANASGRDDPPVAPPPLCALCPVAIYSFIKYMFISSGSLFPEKYGSAVVVVVL